MSYLQAARNEMDNEGVPDPDLNTETDERWMPTVWTTVKGTKESIGTKGTSTAHRIWFQLCSVLRAAANTVGDCDTAPQELYINLNRTKEGILTSEF